MAGELESELMQDKALEILLAHPEAAFVLKVSSQALAGADPKLRPGEFEMPKASLDAGSVKKSPTLCVFPPCSDSFQ